MRKKPDIEPMVPGVHDVTFMDRDGSRVLRPRLAQLNCVPELFVRLESLGIEGTVKRTWVLKMTKGKAVYWEQPSVMFDRDAFFQGKKKTKDETETEHED